MNKSPLLVIKVESILFPQRLDGFLQCVSQAWLTSSWSPRLILLSRALQFRHTLSLVQSNCSRTNVNEKRLMDAFHTTSRVTSKALANEDTLLETHCCRHKCFPVCPRAQHLLRTQILCPEHKKCFWFCSETFCVFNKCFPVCAAQGTSWAAMCTQQCVLVYQGLYTFLFHSCVSLARALRASARSPLGFWYGVCQLATMGFFAQMKGAARNVCTFFNVHCHF